MSEHVNLKEAITLLLQSYTVAIKQLFDSLAIAARTDPTTPQHVFAKLIEKDHKLHNYVAQLEEHQLFQEKLAQLARDMAVQDDQIMDLAANLKSVEHSLHMNIQTELSHIQTIKNSAAHGGIYAPDIVSYGHKISYTTSAPPGWVPAQVAVFKPPAPQEEQVRTGLLYSKMPDHILKYFSLEDSNKAPPAATTAFPTVLDGHSQPNNVMPEVEPITAPIDFQKLTIPLPPKGWKAGMPIIPLPPKGWKPGDQILGPLLIEFRDASIGGVSDIKTEHLSEGDASRAGDVEWE